jgi:hypothetical protein
MKKALPVIFLFSLVVLLAAVAQTQGASAAKPSVPKGWSFSVPEGDWQAGKQVFMRMECYSCHTIKLPKETLAARPGKVGPELTGYSGLPREYLASSIIKAHTVVAAPGYTVKEGKAAMGNYNHFMTIQELIDLVAFLKNFEKDGAK